ncbi:MAG: LCP family protein [Lachnospiraceae bacterium]|jgi:LCP family protein required for cell wall assembly
MNSRQNPGHKASKKPERRGRYARRGSRIGRITLILAEVVTILVLTVGVYGVNLLGTLERSDIDENQIYVYNGNNSNSGDLVVDAITDETEVPESLDDYAEETADDSLIAADASEGDWEIETQEIDSGDDFLSLQETTEGYWNILILGVDARLNQSLADGDYRADVIIICSINVSTREVKLASVYRDTVMKMYDQNDYIKANDGVFAALGGSPSEMISMINLNLDMNIKDILIVNWASAALAVNALGGLDLEITQEELDRGIIQGYLTEVVNETGIGTDGQFTEAGLQHCDGPKVVAYCRNRYTTGSDFGRTSRQREVLEKLLEKAKSADIGTLFNLVRIVFSNIYTTLDYGEMFSLASDLKSLNIVDSTGFPMEYETNSTMGLLTSQYDLTDALIANTLESNAIELHQFLYGDDGYTPSDNLKTISDNIDYLAHTS